MDFCFKSTNEEKKIVRLIWVTQNKLWTHEKFVRDENPYIEREREKRQFYHLFVRFFPHHHIWKRGRIFSCVFFFSPLPLSLSLQMIENENINDFILDRGIEKVFSFTCIYSSDVYFYFLGIDFRFMPNGTLNRFKQILSLLCIKLQTMSMLLFFHHPSSVTIRHQYFIKQISVCFCVQL